jgi:hypothetical protein
MPNQNAGNYQAIPMALAFMNFLPSISLIFTGFVVFAFGEIIQLAIDIATNTAEMVEHGRETSAFFGRVAAKSNPAPEPQARR